MNAFPTRRTTVLLLAVLALSPLLGACKSRRAKEDPILQLAAAESLTEGKRLMDKGKYSQARKYLSHAFEIEPNSISGREALLLVADSLYLQGGSANLIQAEAKYRDFLNRFPTSDRAAYVQYQVGSSLAERVERSDRDQNVTHQALTAFEEVLRLYPTSEQAGKAKERVIELRGRLAEHEFNVARFYLRYGLPQATASRLQRLLSDFPEYGNKERVYFMLGIAKEQLHKPEEADEWFGKLREEFPQSDLIADIPKREVIPERSPDILKPPVATAPPGNQG
jgi:outer membrane protein assembly factor BamD